MRTPLVRLVTVRVTSIRYRRTNLRRSRKRYIPPMSTADIPSEPLSSETAPHISSHLIRNGPSNPPASASRTPITDNIRQTLAKALNPTTLEIRNDSHQHAHHAAMASHTDSLDLEGRPLERETHFAVYVVSEKFEGMNQPARHRMVYGLLREEMSRVGGIHALSLKTYTKAQAEKLGN